MKTLIFFFFFITGPLSLFSQEGVSITTDNSPAAATAILDVKSTTKGMLIPRMLTAQRVAIGSGTPATGLLVYDLTTTSFWYYNGTAWVELVGGYVSELRDADNDTKVQVEEGPDEDKIRFDLDGEEKMVLDRNANDVVRLDIMDIGNNTYVGQWAGLYTELGTENTGIGVYSLLENLNGNYNTALGFQSLGNNENGQYNTGVGKSAISNNRSGSYNTSFGSETLLSNRGNSRSTAIGCYAMLYAHDGFSGYPTYNTAVGYTALRGSGTPGENSGQFNTAIGDAAMFSNTSGSSNVAVGSESLVSNTTGLRNVAIGEAALGANTTGYDNTATGVSSLYYNRANRRSTAIGSRAMYYADNREVDGRATYNTAVGYEALYGSAMPANNNGRFNTAIGDRALFSNTSGYSNTSTGAAALSLNTTGSNNTATGDSSLHFNQGWDNTAAGGKSLLSNTYGLSNTASGFAAMTSNTVGNNNSAFGRSSLQATTTGSHNTAIGTSALHFNSANSRSTAVGYNAMRLADSRILDGRETFNTAIGYEALRGSVPQENNTGRYNTAIGDQALFSNSFGSSNTANGYHALYSNTTGSNNNANGHGALSVNSGGSFNTAFGDSALYYALYSRNTALGASSGTDSDNSNNCSYIGFDADNDFYWNTYTNSTAIGNGARITAANQIRVGNTTVLTIGGNTSWTVWSDGRYKTDVQENVPGLAFINKLRPVTYHLDVHGLAHKLNEDAIDTRGDQSLNKPSASTIASRNQRAEIVETGFIAQEVEAVAKEVGYAFSGVDAPKNETDLYGLRYAQFVVPLVKAVQEQQALIEALQKENTQLKATNDHRWLEQQAQNNALQTMIDELKIK